MRAESTELPHSDMKSRMHAFFDLRRIRVIIMRLMDSLLTICT